MTFTPGQGSKASAPPGSKGPSAVTLPFVPGKLGLAAKFDGRSLANGGKVANFDYLDPVTLAAWIYPTAPNGAVSQA